MTSLFVSSSVNVGKYLFSQQNVGSLQPLDIIQFYVAENIFSVHHVAREPISHVHVLPPKSDKANCMTDKRFISNIFSTYIMVSRLLTYLLAS